MNSQFDTSTTPTTVSVGWIHENVIERWHIEKLLRLKGLIEKEIVTRTMTGKHPDSKRGNDSD